MTKYEVLNQLSSNEIDYHKAYELLYPKIKQRKAKKAKPNKLFFLSQNFKSIFYED